MNTYIIPKAGRTYRQYVDYCISLRASPLPVNESTTI